MSADNRYPTQTSIRSLSHKLNLPKPDDFEQDWEYVVADANRIQDYLDLYSFNSDLTTDERYTLMIIIIESMNDALTSSQDISDQWEQLSELINNDKKIHQDTLNKYANWHENDLENCFVITPLIRLLMKKLY